MNYYEMLLMNLFSPWRWVVIVLLMIVFVVSGVRFTMLDNIKRRMLIVDPDDRDPVSTIEYMHEHMAKRPLREKPGFWLTFQLLSCAAIVSILFLPLLCTFTAFTTYCP